MRPVFRPLAILVFLLFLIGSVNAWYSGASDFSERIDLNISNLDGFNYVADTNRTARITLDTTNSTRFNDVNCLMVVKDEAVEVDLNVANFGTASTTLDFRYNQALTAGTDDVTHYKLYVKCGTPEYRPRRPEYVYGLWDTFADGGYTSSGEGNPAWTVGNGGTWSISSGQLLGNTTGATPNDWTYIGTDHYKNYDGNLGNYEVGFKTDFVSAGNDDVWHVNWSNAKNATHVLDGDAHATLVEGYYNGGGASDFHLRRRHTGYYTIDNSTDDQGANEHTHLVTRTSAGLWTLYWDGVSTLSGTDIVTQDGNWFVVVVGNVTSGAVADFDNIHVAMLTGDANITGSWKAASALSVSFTSTTPNALDPENSINSVTVDLNDTSTCTGCDVNGWQWDENSTPISTDQNYVHTFNAIGDYNVSLTADANNGESGVAWEVISVYQYPQDVNFVWSPNTGYVNQTFDFNATATGTVDLWTWSFNGEAFSNDQNTTHAFSTSGDKNVCITATRNGDTDLNKTTCYSVGVYGYLAITMTDENSGAYLQPTTTFNGSSITLDENGYWTTSLEGFSQGQYTLTAYDANRSRRYWVFDLNQYSQVDMNVVLLPTTLGKDVNFQFYDPNLDALPNARIRFWKTDTNKTVSIRYTDSEARQSFFINPNDENYAVDLTSADGNFYTYYAVTATVMRPKDEKTRVNIDDNYNIYVSGLALQEYTDINAASQSFQMYANVSDYWVITVESDNNTYYNRSYAIQVLGSTTSYNLQPYLVSTSDGILSWFYVLDNQTRETLQDVLIVIKKEIPEEGIITIQSKESDASGVATMPLVAQDTYYVDFYYDEKLVASNMRIEATSTSYYVYLDLTTLEGTATAGTIDINFFPSTGRLTPSSPTVHLQQTITQSSSAISSIQIVITNAGITLFDQTYTTNVQYGAVYTQDLNTSSLNPNQPMKVTVTVVSATGTTTQTTSYFLSISADLIGGGTWDIRTTLDAVKTQTLGDFGAMFIAIIITIAIIGSLTVFGLDNNAIFIVALGIFGIFTYLGWVPILVFGLAALGGFGAFILMRRF